MNLFIGLFSAEQGFVSSTRLLGILPFYEFVDWVLTLGLILGQQKPDKF